MRCAREREIHADLARQMVEKGRRADIGKKPDQGLRHREDGVLADHAMRTVHRNAATAAEGETVDQRDIGLGKPADGRIHPVLGPEEAHHAAVGASAGIVDGADVSTGAERLSRHRIDDDRMDRAINSPSP